MEANNFKYQFALSFYGGKGDNSKDRIFVSKVYKLLIDCIPHIKDKIFYDNEYEISLTGSDIITKLHKIFGTESKFCVFFTSKNFLISKYPKIELEAALSRRIFTGNFNHIVNIKFDETEIEGILPTMAYIGNIDRESQEDIKRVCIILAKKINASDEIIGNIKNHTYEIQNDLKEISKKVVIPNILIKKLSPYFKYIVTLIAILVVILAYFIIFSPNPIEENSKIESGKVFNDSDVLNFLQYRYKMKNNNISDDDIFLSDSINYLDDEGSVLDSNIFFSNPFIQSSENKIIDLGMGKKDSSDSYYEINYWLTNKRDTLIAKLIGQIDSGKLIINSISYLNRIEKKITGASDSSRKSNEKSINEKQPSRQEPHIDIVTETTLVNNSPVMESSEKISIEKKDEENNLKIQEEIKSILKQDHTKDENKDTDYKSILKGNQER